jgi:carboxylate-amine ligase
VRSGRSGDTFDVATTVNLDAAALRASFEGGGPMTVGMEEELMLLDGDTLDLTPRAREVLDLLAGDVRFKDELPAAQLEIAGPIAGTVAEAAAALHAARAALAAVAAPLGIRVAGGGIHPFAAAEGALNGGERYDAIAAEFGMIAHRQLVFGLHVHVAVAGADRSLAVYNAVREHLPALAALSSASPFYEGRDTGLASVRPKVCDLLPRQGVPPAVPSWEALAEVFAWGRATETFADPGQWWFEARLHPLHGTIEVRVPDAQSTVADSAALAAIVHALVATLAERYDAGEDLGAAASWKIGENRWSACRHGVEGRWIDVHSGTVRPTRDHLHALLDTLAPAAQRLGCAAELAGARDLIEHPRAALVREVARDGGPRAVAAWLADRHLGA